MSTPRAATVVVAASLLVAAVAVTPSFAGSFLTSKRAGHLYLTNKKASALYLKRKAADNTFVKKADAPLPSKVGIAAGTAVYSSNATTAGYIPTAFTSFGLPGIGSAVITFSGSATCTTETPGVDLACPIQILVDGQSQGKVNVAPAVAASPTPALLAATVTSTTVLGKGGHTVAIQYAGAKDVSFSLKGWNLAVQAYPQPDEPLVFETTEGTTK